VQWRYGGAEKDGIVEECIPLQLQRLFAALQLSQRGAVGTSDLTQSFGWTAAQAFRQHDVQELCRVLFDALDDATRTNGRPSIVDTVFKGEVRAARASWRYHKPQTTLILSPWELVFVHSPTLPRHAHSA
jgi:hypothetical protein